MATNYDAYKTKYQMDMELAIQQRETYLTGNFTKGTITGDRMTIDFLQSVEGQTAVGLNESTILVEPEWERRSVTLKRDYVAIPVDRKQVLFLLEDPTSSIITTSKSYINRKMDTFAYEAFDADVRTGQDGTGTAVFDTDNVVAATSGMTFDVLNSSKELLDDNLIGDYSMEDHFMLVTPTQCRQLLAETKVSSADYNSIRVLVDGKVGSFMGFNFIKFPKTIATATGTVRKCFAWAKEGMYWGNNAGVTVEIDDLPTKVYSTQVFCEFYANALRKYDELVIRIDAEENPS